MFWCLSWESPEQVKPPKFPKRLPSNQSGQSAAVAAPGVVVRSQGGKTWEGLDVVPTRTLPPLPIAADIMGNSVLEPWVRCAAGLLRRRALWLYAGAFSQRESNTLGFMPVEKMLLLLLECPGGEGESTLSHKCAPVAVSRDGNSVVFACTGQPSWGGSRGLREKDAHLG